MERTADVPALVPMLRVASVTRSIAFYEQLGFSLRNVEGEAEPWWANVCASGGAGAAELMLSKVSAPHEPGSTVLYYYVKDVRALHARLSAAGIAVTTIESREYASAGEFEVSDPDGHRLLVGQPDC